MEIPDYVRFVLDRLRARGFSGFLVGGCVRDALMGKTPADYDIAVSCTPAETEACFADCRVIGTGLRHGTVTVVADGHNLELTTFREDGAYLDHRRPENVRFTRSLEADLSRRDFTVNAMAYSPDGGLVDLFGGEADLRAGILRAVGDPAVRFDEDALRILRALRFAATLGFTVEPATAAAAVGQRALLGSVSAERKCAELKKLLAGRFSGPVLTAFRPVLEETLPCLRALPPGKYAAAAETAAAFDDPAFALAALLADCGDRAAEEACRALKTDNAFLRTCVFLVRYRTAYAETVGAAQRFIGAQGERLCLGLSAFRETAGVRADPCLTAALADPGACRRIADLRIRGGDLEKLGLTGRRTGEVLDALLTAVTEGRLENRRAALLDAARRM